MGHKEKLTRKQMAVLGVERRKLLNAGYSRTSRERARQPLPIPTPKKGHKKGPFKNKRSKKSAPSGEGNTVTGQRKRGAAAKTVKPRAPKDLP